MTVKLRIVHDVDAENPRDCDNLGTMVCFSKRYNLGDKHDYESPVAFLRSLVGVETEADLTPKELFDMASKKVLILPLYLLDHSGLSINTTGFGFCDFSGWDWGQVGWIYVTREKLKKEGLDDKTDDEIFKLLESEVEVYEQYVQGDTWGFVLEKSIECPHCKQVNTEVIDSCWGFYGMDWESNGLKDYLPEEYHHLLESVHPEIYK